ncbi:hypothetical protein [Streptomyces sp. WAC 01529]|uniref:hypothetical protein n=1 Tax=Streptomyces sp. WAC 01529 TaxID=2203205 RepID=UPI0013DF4D15|nr:hypothetical protein [Streptomyces sp. WAC 01529]
MRVRTILAAVALATATIIGGTATATADDGPGDLPSFHKLCEETVGNVLQQGCLG